MTRPAFQVHTQDQFFSDGETARASLLDESYQGIVSPFDGVFYPDIAKIDPVLEAELWFGVQEIVGERIRASAIFARLSVDGVKAPHQVHTDAIMGDYTAIVYMNAPEHCQGGTSVLRHRETSLATHPTTPEEIAYCTRDSNDPTKWVTTYFAEMVFNRIFVCDSKLFHRSEPIGGFGKTVADGRLVVVGFFNRAREK